MNYTQSIYRVGVLGCGRIASRFDDDPKRKNISTHIGAYMKAKKTRVCAVCDINAINLKECMNRWEIDNGYQDVTEMLKKERLDIVSICTPSGTHYEILKKVVRFPVKAIFCEKPIADSVYKARGMVELCRKNKIILQVGHQRRFDPLHQRLKKCIYERRWGKPQKANFYYTAGIKNTGSHMFDLLRFFFGEADWIEAFYCKNRPLGVDDPNLDGIIMFKNGVFATFQSFDVNKYLIFEMNCFFEYGRVVLAHSGFDIDCYSVKDSAYFLGYKELEKGPPCLGAVNRKDFMVNAVNHMVECIDKGKDSISSGYDGLKSLELIEKSIY